jgi:hypothetical protein
MVNVATHLDIWVAASLRVSIAMETSPRAATALPPLAMMSETTLSAPSLLDALIHHYSSTRGCERFCYTCSDALGCSRHHCYLARQIVHVSNCSCCHPYNFFVKCVWMVGDRCLPDHHEIKPAITRRNPDSCSLYPDRLLSAFFSILLAKKGVSCALCADEAKS